MDYFEQFVTDGEWSKAEEYLSACTDGNAECSANMLYEMRKHEYLEAKDRLNWWVPYRFICFLENQNLTFENIPKVGTETYFSDVHSVSSVNAVSWKLKEINEPSECRTLILPDSPLAERELNSFGGPPCTYFTFCNEHSLALGFNNSSIVIRCLNTKTQAKLEGHGKRITCLAFSNKLNVLVSAGGDAQWVPTEAECPITSATYSSDGQSIYVSFKTGCIKFAGLVAYPLVIAAHPTNPNQ
ncbi:hypothetical protein COLO4_08643 [Corchorus olitorius]|uniref:Peptidase A1 domain-containing protein n=1 Tax=Corchorus olitorius TaxID=93759 RepID=A0A1R3KF62_9ROSI|nr:hypothetical protein COLO4_08643 [Corchorus olitorius]